MQVHLVDATYELFRAHFAPRPPVLGRDGVNLSGVSGLCEQLLYLLLCVLRFFVRYVVFHGGS